MPLFPYRDRSITMTLENAYYGVNQQGQKTGVKPKSFLSQYLPTSGVLGLVANTVLKPSETLTLKGPTEIGVDYDADVASEAGLFTNFLQAWFIKNAVVHVRGESYLGAFTAVSLPDGDAEGVLQAFLTGLRDFSSQLGASGTRERVVLEIGNNPQGGARFLGYIKSFHFSENVKKPYMLDYSIEFVGKELSDVSLGAGKAAAAQASGMFGGSPLGGLVS